MKLLIAWFFVIANLLAIVGVIAAHYWVGDAWTRWQFATMAFNFAVAGWTLWEILEGVHSPHSWPAADTRQRIPAADVQRMSSEELRHLVASRAMTTGKIVIGNLDDDGDLVFEEQEAPR